MALKATIHKATLNIADMDRHYYADHHLTVAQHPSENDERMMIRILAFAMNAGEHLEFTKGLSTDDEPELWQKSLSDEIELWIALGLPVAGRLRTAFNRARPVILYAYGGRAVPLWWEKHHNKLSRFDNLTIVNLPPEATDALAKLAHRSMSLQITIQDGVVGISDDTQPVQLEPGPIV